MRKEKDHRKNTTLGIVSFVIAISAALLPMPIILIYPFALAAFITGLIDLFRNDESVKHFCSFFGFVIGLVLLIFYANNYMVFLKMQ